MAARLQNTIFPFFSKRMKLTKVQLSVVHRSTVEPCIIVPIWNVFLRKGRSSDVNTFPWGDHPSLSDSKSPSCVLILSHRLYLLNLSWMIMPGSLFGHHSAGSSSSQGYCEGPSIRSLPRTEQVVSVDNPDPPPSHWREPHWVWRPAKAESCFIVTGMCLFRVEKVGGHLRMGWCVRANNIPPC